VALREEPRLNPEITRAFRVPDGNIDVWKTVWALAHGANNAAPASCPTRGHRHPARRDEVTAPASTMCAA